MCKCRVKKDNESSEQNAAFPTRSLNILSSLVFLIFCPSLDLFSSLAITSQFVIYEEKKLIQISFFSFFFSYSLDGSFSGPFYFSLSFAPIMDLTMSQPSVATFPLLSGPAPC